MAIATINPATGEVVKQFQALTDAEVDGRIAKAARAFQSFRKTSFADRAKWMLKAGEILEAEKTELGRLMTLEMGKTFSSAVAEAAKCATACQYYAENAAKFVVDEVIETSATKSYIHYQPVGIVLAVYFATRRAICKPIQTLTAVAKELGTGNLDQVVPVQSNDEIGALAAAFNKLASKLRAYRRITADHILQARQMTEITFSAFPDAILALSVDGKIDFANPAAEELLKRLGSEVGLPLRIRQEAENVLKGAADYMPTSFEKAVPVLINEHEAYLLPRVIGMRDESGKLFGAAIVLLDVTRFRLMDEIKTDLVSTVSHELKTPLSSIRMGLHLLLEERIGALNPKQVELLLAAREDSERLLRMINDLLDLARLESGQIRQRFEIVAPGTLIKNAAPDLKPLVEANDARLVTDTSGELPDVAVDLRQIGDVFSNLVSNAARHSMPGEDVVLSTKPIGKSVRFSVLDHGLGILREFQSRIFERFFRIPGTEDSTGVGRGLAIAKEMVVSHGGSIGLQSTSGEGSEFYFDLPAISKGATDE